MKKKAIVPVLLIISLVMSSLSLYLDAQYFVLESDRYDSIGEYFIYNGRSEEHTSELQSLA